MSNQDPTGEVIQQHEPEDPLDYVPVRVQTEGPVRVTLLPEPIGFAVSKVVAASDLGVKLLGRDPRRGRGVIISLDQPFYYGNTEAEAEAGTSAAWPDAVPLPITHGDEVWVMCAAAGSSTTISYVGGLWTE